MGAAAEARRASPRPARRRTAPARPFHRIPPLPPSYRLPAESPREPGGHKVGRGRHRGAGAAVQRAAGSRAAVAPGARPWAERGLAGSRLAGAGRHAARRRCESGAVAAPACTVPPPPAPSRPPRAMAEPAAPPAPPAASDAAPAAQSVDPWTVQGGADGKIDYDKLCRDVRKRMGGGWRGGALGAPAGPRCGRPTRPPHL